MFRSRMSEKALVALALFAGMAGLVAETYAQLPPPGAPPWRCDKTTTYLCPGCENISGGQACYNASSPNYWLLCTYSGSFPCNAFNTLNCTGGLRYSKPCGQGGAMVGGCSYAEPSC
ncbi:MAG: hypothetical protein K2X87_17175 [Gemmataceae bacterium]|nr:hypothetical protein [Gemmataceae bacterium]